MALLLQSLKFLLLLLVLRVQRRFLRLLGLLFRLLVLGIWLRL